MPATQSSLCGYAENICRNKNYGYPYSFITEVIYNGLFEGIISGKNLETQIYE